MSLTSKDVAWFTIALLIGTYVSILSSGVTP